MKLKITKLFTKEEQGLKGPYTRLAIKAQEYGDKWISGFLGKATEHWQEGMEVDAEVYASEKTDKNGQAYLNFRPLSKLDLLEKRVVEIEKILQKKNVSEKEEIPVIDEQTEQDLPF